MEHYNISLRACCGNDDIGMMVSTLSFVGSTRCYWISEWSSTRHSKIPTLQTHAIHITQRIAGDEATGSWVEPASADVVEREVAVDCSVGIGVTVGDKCGESANTTTPTIHWLPRSEIELNFYRVVSPSASEIHDCRLELFQARLGCSNAE